MKPEPISRPSAPVTDFSPGFPVEIGLIDKALKQLWEDSGETKTRASLINLAIYTEDAEAVAKNTRLISQIAGEHACRAILIHARPDAPESGARAWISAHCRTSGQGQGQVCSEQITFQLDAAAAAALPNVVFSHLDSDLPLCFWWQAPFRAPLDAKLWSWVDRLIFDSQTWDHPGGQIRLVQDIAALSGVRTVLCDLNWSRILNLRVALANLFDHSAALASLREVDHVAITHAPGARLTALLLIGWFATQLGWRLDSVLSQHSFSAPGRRHAGFSLREAPGSCVSEVRIRAGASEFTLAHEKEARFFHANLCFDGDDKQSLLLPAGRGAIRDVLLMELSRGGVHPLYHKALDTIHPLISEAY